MRKSIVCAAFSLAILSLPCTPAAQAQDAPKRCGGLLCDMGLFGGSGSAASALPCHDFLCRALGGKQAEAAPPAPEAAPMSAEPSPAKLRKRKHLAKADAMRSMPDAASK